MRKFIIKVLVFSLLFWAVDKLALLILDEAPKHAFDPRLEMVMKGEINKDFVVVGSSRGAKAVIIDQIEEATGLSGFSLCNNGTDVVFHEFIIRCLLKNNAPPKTILLTADDPVQLWSQDGYGFRADLVVPLSNYDDCNDALITNEVNEEVSRYLLIPRLKYDHFFPQSPKISSFETLRPGGSQWLRHYPENRDFEYFSDQYDQSREENYKKKSLARIEAMCRDYGVQLIMIYPPNFKDFTEAFELRMRELMGPDVLHWIYNCHDPRYLNKDLFYDPDHLFVTGAQIYTDELIDSLRVLDVLQP